MWMCKLHNIVNKDIGKKQHECSKLGLDLKYLKNCGECKVPKPGEGAKSASGFHPDSGPWDADMYAKSPQVLQKVTSVTQLFKARREQDLLDILSKMQVINAKQRTSLEAKLAGPSGKATLKALQDAVKEAKASLRASVATALGYGYR